MNIDKINDEFIVDCTNNPKEERRQVYKFLVDNRDYGIHYLTNDYPIIACNKRSGQTNWDTLIQYNWFNAKKDIPVYTFEQFKEMYLNENKMYSIKDLEKRKNGKCWVVQINTENEHKFLKSYFPEMTYYKSVLNGYIVDMTNCGISEFCNYDGGDYNKITINQIKEWNMENKKIIGYKLIKPEYKDAALKIGDSTGFNTDNNNTQSYLKEDVLLSYASRSIRNLKEAGVLDLWFEPVYEEEYKVGDWVFGEILGTSLYNYEKNPVKILEIGGGYFRYDLDSVYSTSFSKGEISSRYELKQITKKATSDEIKQAQKTIVNMHSSNKGEFEIEVVDGKAWYRKEDKELPKKWIKDIINIFGEQGGINYPYKIEVESVRVGCMEGTRKEDWENVYKLLK